MRSLKGQNKEEEKKALRDLRLIVTRGKQIRNRKKRKKRKRKEEKEGEGGEEDEGQKKKEKGKKEKADGGNDRPHEGKDKDSGRNHEEEGGGRGTPDKAKEREEEARDVALTLGIDLTALRTTLSEVRRLRNDKVELSSVFQEAEKLLSERERQGERERAKLGWEGGLEREQG